MKPVQTSDYSGVEGFDQNIGHNAIVAERKIITIAWKWENEKKTYALEWDKNQDDYEMLVKFMKVAETADEMVAHYGDRFDLPWFKTRLMIQGVQPFPDIKTVDTKAWASKNFYFNSNKLDYIGQVLKEGKKLDTDFDLWKDILLHKCPAAMRKMVTYNIQDVVLLEKVYKRLALWIKPKTHAGVFNGLDKWTCPRTGSLDVVKSKTRVSAAGTITHQMKCLDNGGYFTISHRAYKEFQEYLKKHV